MGLTQWGYKDLSALCPIVNGSLEVFEQEIFNIVYHLRQQRSEVMSWPSRTRRRIWKQFKDQKQYEADQQKG